MYNDKENEKYTETSIKNVTRFFTRYAVEGWPFEMYILQITEVLKVLQKTKNLTNCTAFCFFSVKKSDKSYAVSLSINIKLLFT